MPNKSFVVHDKVSSVVEETIRLFADKTSIHELSRTFDPNELTECGRKIVYRSIAENYKLPISELELYTNQYAKVKWIQMLHKMSGIKVIDSWAKASDCNYNMVSTIDCVIEIAALDDMQSIVYIKSLPSSDYKYVVGHGAPRKDIVRVTTDMWLIEIPKAIIIYENRDTLEYTAYSVLPQNAIINSIKLKAKELYAYKLNGEIPPRPYKICTSIECQACEFSKTCWS